MAYNFPASGGIKVTANGKTVGVFAANTVLGPILIVGELTTDGWLGRWTYGPHMEDEFRRRIDAAGGNVQFIRSLIQQITEAIRNLFGVQSPAPSPIPDTVVNGLNHALSNYFFIDADGLHEI